MKLVNYKLQTQMENLNESSTNIHFKDYLKSILEDTNTPYFQKADYIGLSLQEIASKIEYIGTDIRELQAYKKKLQTALALAKELVADVLIQNGVDRVDGNLISSLTLQAESISTKSDLIILDENKVMTLGYVKFSVDIEAIEKALQTKEGKKELKKYVEVMPITVTTPAKIKVNTKRVAVSNVEAIEVDEILVIEQQMEDEYKNEYKKLAA